MDVSLFSVPPLLGGSAPWGGQEFNFAWAPGLLCVGAQTVLGVLPVIASAVKGGSLAMFCVLGDPMGRLH
eukprot:10950303-Heterocapsa_arctica.AAC.1